MRLRKLGRGQSVVFMMPAEIRRKIIAMPGMAMNANNNITVSQVLCWSVYETWLSLRRLAPLWAAQGLRHQRQQLLWERADTGETYHFQPKDAAQFLERASQTLLQQYRPPVVLEADISVGHGNNSSDATPPPLPEPSSPRDAQAAQIRARCLALNVSTVRQDHNADLEQQRELLTEAEEQCQREPPPSLSPLEPCVHDDVKTFVETGVIPNGSPAFMPALESLLGTSVGHLVVPVRLRRLDDSGPNPDLVLVTADFAGVVHKPPTASGHVLDEFQRPVQWIATASGAAPGTLVAVVLSPFEANALLPTFRTRRSAATLHLFAPRTKLNTRSVEHLALYATPPLPLGWTAPRPLVVLLLMFAGQLYLRSYADYVAICQLLRVTHQAGNSESEGGADGKGGDERPDKPNVPCTIDLFRNLVHRIRHDYADISRTDVGCILANEVLSRERFHDPARRDGNNYIIQRS